MSKNVYPLPLRFALLNHHDSGKVLILDTVANMSWSIDSKDWDAERKRLYEMYEKCP